MCDPGRPSISVKNRQDPSTLAPLVNKSSNPLVVAELWESYTSTPLHTDWESGVHLLITTERDGYFGGSCLSRRGWPSLMI